MTVTVEIPDELGEVLAAQGSEPSRAVLEAIALEGYRRELLTEAAVRRMLGFETRMDVHAFLKKHDTYLNYTAEDAKHDIAEARRYPTLGRERALVRQRCG